MLPAALAANSIETVAAPLEHELIEVVILLILLALYQQLLRKEQVQRVNWPLLRFSRQPMLNHLINLLQPATSSGLTTRTRHPLV